MKILGLSSSKTENRIVLNRAYHDGLSRDGVATVALPIFGSGSREVITIDRYIEKNGNKIAALVDRMDAIVITGGSDVSPLTFNDVNWGSSGHDMERDLMELALVRAAFAQGKPVLGICRGFQLVGLHIEMPYFSQDLSSSEVKETHNALSDDIKDRSEPAHQVAVFGDLKKYIREKTGIDDLHRINVSSYHHQGFLITRDGKISKGAGNYGERYYKSITEYEEHGVKVLCATTSVIEGVEKPEFKYVGYQSHPEEIPGSLLIQYWLDRYVLL